MAKIVTVGTLSALDLDNLSLPSELDGRSGSNRSTHANPQIAANTDIDALKAWLARYLDTKTTFDSYRKEAERLLLWSVYELGKPLSSLTHEDLLGYQNFLGAPPDNWIMKTGRKLARSDPGWRPFSGPLSATSQRQAIVILNALFSWLVNAGYLAGNPLSLSRHRHRKTKPRITRYLDDQIWQEVKTYIEALPQNTQREKAHYGRVRWLFSLLFLCGLRISEVTQNNMGAFYCQRERNGGERWWLEITGKGDKTRLVPATTELMAELQQYRIGYGLPPYPSPLELTPLLMPVSGKPKPLTRSAVHQIVKEIFTHTALSLRHRGPEYEAKASALEKASAHWLRHTAGSMMTDGEMDLRYVRDNLGHESLTTTSLYLHSDDNKRHQATENSHRLGWGATLPRFE